MAQYKSSSTIENEARRLKLLSSLGKEVTLEALHEAKEILRPKAESRKLKAIHILDAGCGVGEDFKIFKRIFPDCEITGLDSSQKALEKAEATGLAQDLWEGNILDYQSYKSYASYKTYNLVFTKHVLMHLNLAPKTLRILGFLGVPGARNLVKKQGSRGVLKALTNLKMLMKPGGVMIAIDPDYTLMSCPFQEFAIFKKCLIKTMQNFGIDPFFGSKTSQYLKEAGFQVQKTLETDMKIKTNDEGWEIMAMLYEVAGKPLQKSLQKNGVDNFEKALRRARRNPKNIFSFKATMGAAGVLAP